MKDLFNIALMGNCTTEYLGKAILEQCGSYSIAANIYNSPFNQYSQEILNSQSRFYMSEPHLTIFLLEGKLLFPQWYDFEILQLDIESKEGMVLKTFQDIVQLLEKLHSLCRTKIIFNNFKIPYHSPLGILDNRYVPGLKQMIASLNALLEEYASKTEYLYIFDYNGLCSYMGQSKTEDPKMYYLIKSTMALPFTKVLAHEYMRYILPFRSRNKKCIVLDLDNTLWGGVAGEDGINGINLDIAGTGRSYYDFQKELVNLYKKGIILAVNSKNSVQDAMDIMENHPHMLLRKKYFACIKINWQDKVENLKEISKELNIGIDSLVFIDDNPVEREYVKSMLPQVTVIDLPEDTGKYVEALKQIIEFETLSIMEEDFARNRMYEENQKRLEAQQQFKNRNEYLASLNTKLVVSYASDFSIPRLAQLTQKTNQFNMTTIRYQVADLENMLASGNYLIFSCSVTDKFGDSGIVGCCIVKVEGMDAAIDSFLLSCRVLGRNVEYAFLSSVVGIITKKGVQYVRAKFILTPKNISNENFYVLAGFVKDTCNEHEVSYILDTANKLKNFEYIDVMVCEGGSRNG